MQSGQGETSSRQRFAAGTRIRRVANPSDLGCCTGAVEGHEGDLEIEVSFGNRHPEWVMEGEIELLDSGPRDPVDLLLAGQASRFRDLRRELVRTQLSGRLSEMFYSMDTTGTQFMPHQFKPVLAMLDSPSKGLLIADEVGLGKTIEASATLPDGQIKTLIKIPNWDFNWQDDYRYRQPVTLPAGTRIDMRFTYDGQKMMLAG